MLTRSFVARVFITFIASFLGLWMAINIKLGYGWHFAFSGALAAGMMAYLAGSATTPWASKKSLPITIWAMGIVALGHIAALTPFFGATLGCLVYAVTILTLGWFRSVHLGSR